MANFTPGLNNSCSGMAIEEIRPLWEMLLAMDDLLEHICALSPAGSAGGEHLGGFLQSYLDEAGRRPADSDYDLLQYFVDAYVIGTLYLIALRLAGTSGIAPGDVAREARVRRWRRILRRMMPAATRGIDRRIRDQFDPESARANARKRRFFVEHHLLN